MTTAKSISKWEPSKIDGTKVHKFTVRIGPTGGKKGYEAITGKEFKIDIQAGVHTMEHPGYKNSHGQVVQDAKVTNRPCSVILTLIYYHIRSN